uniref:Retrotransposon protein, putative, Ty1-copia subclass n=1 Tax=Tanacetum cinerariifolium TaxID=118510 RepID=A0A6L2LIM1_TANCI|nr:retrotransposon protein, putative, Ty1-copia subclass [Tanacetum cinerariifolium]
MTTSVGINSVFRSFFDKQKLTRPNFIDWYRQLRLVLSIEDKENYPEHLIPTAPVAPPRQQVPLEALAAHATWVKGQKEVDVLMLLTMDLEIQRNLAHLGAYDMLQELKSMYSKQAEQELLQIVREFHINKQDEGQSVSSHFLKVNGYIENLERLGQPVGQNLAVSLILVFLNKDFDSFMQNYNMHRMGKTVNELRAMLKLHEETLPKKDANPALHVIRAGKGLKGSKKLKLGALSLYVGDGHRTAVEAIGTYHLELHNTSLNHEEDDQEINEPQSDINPIRKSSRIRRAPDRMCLYIDAEEHELGDLESFFDKQKLTGPNFIDWYRQLRLVLSIEDKENYPEHLIPTAPVAPPRQQVPLEALAAHATWVKGQKEVDELKSMYSKQAEQELLQIVREFHSNKQEEGQSVSSHFLKVKGYIENLERLGQPVGQNLARRNCPVYLAGLMKKKKLSQGASTSAVEAIGTYHLELPSGLVIILNNCHYAPSITRGVISVSRLFDDGFINCFDDNNVISVSKNNLVYFMAVPRDGIYEIDMSCSYTNDSYIKMARKPYSLQVERAKDLLRLIHIDVCGPLKIVSRQGASYFVTFTDDFSHYGYVYLLKHKHKVFETFKVFQKKVEDQLRKTVKSLRSNRGGEYISQEFLDHLKEHGIISHCTPPYTPQKNRVSERRNRTLLDMVRSMMSQTTLPTSFWDYALETAARILNMVPTKKVDKTRYEIWHGQAPKLPSKNKVFIAQNAEFFESKLLYLKASGSVEDLELIQEEDTNPSVDTSLNHKEDDQEIDEPQSDINPIRKSSRRRRAPDRMCLYIDAEEHELGDLGEPANYKAALLDPESKKWLDAMNVEMQSIKDNDIWVLVELPPNARTVGSKWLFKKKSDMDDIRAIRILIAIAAYYDYEIWQMDVKTAFLNGHLLEEVYMEQPEGFVNPKYPNHDMFLVYGGNIKRELRVFCYTDAGYLTDADNLKSHTGYVFVLNGGAVDWKSIKQSIFATSSTDAEYIAAFDASKEAVWIRKFISGLGIVSTIEEPISMYYDNTRVIAIAKDDGVTKGVRHFRTKVHYLRETIKLGDVKIEKIDTDDNLADLFTKALAFPKHSELARNIGLLPASSFMQLCV